jgi:hypothetical protein
VARMSVEVVRNFRRVLAASVGGDCGRFYAHPARSERALEPTAMSSEHCRPRLGKVRTRFAAARTSRLASPHRLSSRATAIRQAPATSRSARSSTAGRFTDPSDRPCRSAQCHHNPRPACGKQHVWNRSAARNRDPRAAMPKSSDARRRLTPCTCRSHRVFTESGESAPLATTCEKHLLPCDGVPDIVIGRRKKSHRLPSQRHDGSTAQTGLP